MYLAGGHAYVYLCYGIHHMLNVVAAEEGNPQAALIRGVQPLDPQREPIVGPGRLTREYGITMAENRLDLRVSDTLWFEDDEYAPPRIETGPRIGIGYASAEDQARPWRYVARL
jgi:DNA-3-methyladenine glycosylase